MFYWAPFELLNLKACSWVSGEHSASPTDDPLNFEEVSTRDDQMDTMDTSLDHAAVVFVFIVKNPPSVAPNSLNSFFFSRVLQRIN